MITELHGTVILSDGEAVPFTAQITPEVDESGCRVYRANLPLFTDADGTPRLIRSAQVDVLPAHSTLDLRLVTDGD